MEPEGKAALDQIEIQAKKLQFLIDALVKMSRLESGILTVHPHTAQVAPLLETTVQQFLPQAEQKGIHLLGNRPNSQRSSTPSGRWRRWEIWWTMRSNTPHPVEQWSFGQSLWSCFAGWMYGTPALELQRRLCQDFYPLLPISGGGG